LSFAVACNNSSQTDSAAVAEEKNEQKEDSTKMGEKLEGDNEFMVEAASGGLMEVQLGELAAQNAASPKVKEFGQRMVKDHTKANEELKAIALKKNISIPATPADKHQHHIDELKAKKGADFDKAYMSMMVEDHEEDISKFEKEGQDGKDTEIKAFAAGKVAILKGHLQMAKAANEGVNQ
jgi:putative membrane protein